MTDFNQQIIPIYSPISARGGSRIHSKNSRTKKYKRNNKSRTRRRYH